MKRILVAYDGGDPAHKALDTAIDLAMAQHATIGVVSVIPVHPGRAPIDPWDDREVHTAELLEAKRTLEQHGIKATFYEPAGEPGATIEKIAEQGDYDTIVVGSRGLGPFERFFQVSISANLATHSEKTVVIAR